MINKRSLKHFTYLDDDGAECEPTDGGGFAWGGVLGAGGGEDCPLSLWLVPSS